MPQFNTGDQVKAANDLTYQTGNAPVIVAKGTSGIVTGAWTFKGGDFYTVHFQGQPHDWPAQNADIV